MDISTSPERHTLQFEFTDEAFEQLEALKVKANLNSNAEVIRNSLRFLTWALDQVNGKGILLVKKDETINEVVFPFW